MVAAAIVPHALLTSEGALSRPNCERREPSRLIGIVVPEEAGKIRATCLIPRPGWQAGTGFVSGEPKMNTIKGSTGTMVSYSSAGSGPPLVLVHGAFSDHETNWTFVAPLFERQFTVYAIA